MARSRQLISVLLLFAISIVIGLALWYGGVPLIDAFARMSWGILWLPLVYAPHVLLAAASWALVFDDAERPGYGKLARAVWIGFSVDSLVPLASMGSEAAKAHLAHREGCSGSGALASVVVDKTVQAIAMACWGFVGCFTLLALAADTLVVVAAFAVTSLLALGIYGFIKVQRAQPIERVMARLERFFGAGQSAYALDAALTRLHARRGAVFWASLLRLPARFVLVLELWVSAQLMGIPLSLGEALMIKSLTDTLRGALFILPGGWGLQEIAYIGLGGLAGLTPELALSASLASRARELLVGLPGLLLWQKLELRAAFRKID